MTYFDCTTKYNLSCLFYLSLSWIFIATMPSSITAQELIPYRQGALWGFADDKQKIVIECQFEEVKPFIVELAKVKKEGKWGLIDKEGKIFLPCKYDIIYAAAKLGRVVAAVGGDQSGHGGKWGFVPKYTGQEIELEYDLIRECGIDNLLGIQKGNYWGAISGQGNLVIPYEYEIERIEEHFFEKSTQKLTADNLKLTKPKDYYLKLEFSEGLARVKKDGKWGYLNRYGNEIIPFKYDFLGELNNGLICAIVSDSLGLKMGMLNAQNEWVVLPEYGFSEDFYREQFFRDALIHVCKNGKWAYLNAKGEIAIPFQYGQAKAFAEGKALVNLSNSQLQAQWQIIDKIGRPVYEFKEGTQPFDNRYWGGAFRILKDAKISFIDLKGNPISNHSFIKTKTFEDGLVQVAFQQGNSLQWGVLKESGEWAIPPEYDFKEAFYLRFLRDTFVVPKQGKWGIINSKNETILPFEYEEIVLPFYERPEIFFRYGLVAVKQGNLWGYVNFKNKVEIPFQYLEAQAFEGEYARIKTKGGWGYIDRKGKEFFEDK